MMKSFNTLLPTLSTISILALALVVQATPLPTKNNVQVTSRNVLADPSTSMRDGEHSIRSYTPFDFSGIFARVDSESPTDPGPGHVKKEEPDLEHNGGLSQIPTRLTMSDLINQEKKEEHDEEEALSRIPTPRQALDKLKEMAKAALRDKQALLFWELSNKIQSYSYDTSNPGPAVPNPNMPQEVRNLALGIWTELQNMWQSRDQEDFVYHNGLFVMRHPYDRLSYADGSSQNRWNPKDFPLKLPAELRDYLESNSRYGMQTQRPLDLGYLIHNLAKTHHNTLDQETYDRMIIVGYQLMLTSAKMIVHFRKRSPAKYLLYLIRDAQHAQPEDLVRLHSDHIKECLTAFNNYLTAEASQRKMRIRKDSVDWRSWRGVNRRAH